MQTLLVIRHFMGVMPIPSTVSAALYTVCTFLLQIGSAWATDLAIIHGNARLGDSIGFAKAGLALSPSLSFDPDRPFSFATWFLAGDIIDRPQAMLDTRHDSEDQHGFVLVLNQQGQIKLRAKAFGRKTQVLVSDHNQYDNNIWHHLAFTISSKGNVTLYIDGSAQSGQIHLHSLKHLYSNSTPNYLGNAMGVDARRFDVFSGRMDEIQHWTAELDEPSILENMCDIVHRRDRPLETVSIRLGAYISKGNLYCYGRFLSRSLDILSVQRGQLFERPLRDAQMQDILRSWSNKIKLWTKSQATMLRQDYQHRYPGRSQDISGAQLIVPPGEGPVYSRFSGTHFHYDPAHRSVVSAWSKWLFNDYFKAAGPRGDGSLRVEGTIVDDTPLGGHQWTERSNEGMRAIANPLVVYDGSFTRRLQGIRRFIAHARRYLPHRVVAVNVTGHEASRKTPESLLSSGLSGAWFEKFIKSYASSSKLGGGDELKRLRDLEFAEKLSAQGIPVIAAMAFEAENPESIQTMLGAYLVAKRSESLKLHPMPVVYSGSAFLTEYFERANAPATLGYSAQYLFEYINKHRSLFELDAGDALSDRKPIDTHLFIRDFENVLVILNISNKIKLVRPESLDVSLEKLDKDLLGRKPAWPLKMPPMSGVILRKH